MLALPQCYLAATAIWLHPAHLSCTLTLRLNGCRRRCYLPAALRQQNDLQDEDLYTGIASAALSNVVFDVASVAKVSLGSKEAIQVCLAGVPGQICRRSGRVPSYLMSLHASELADAVVPSPAGAPG